MIEFQNTVIVISARMASQGLPGKPMVDIHGKPLIVHSWLQAREAKLGAVIVGASEMAIVEAIKAAGGDAIVTPLTARTQIDRAAAVLELRDANKQFQHVVVLSADMPMIDSNAIRRCLAGLTNDTVDAATLAAPLDPGDADSDSNAVKVIAPLSEAREVAYARDFHRTVPQDLQHNAWRFAGVTAYRRNTLERLAAMPPSQNEFVRSIELMRALDAGHRVAAVMIDEVPLRVNSRAALERVRNLMRVQR